MSSGAIVLVVIILMVYGVHVLYLNFELSDKDGTIRDLEDSLKFWQSYARKEASDE